jgi:hypothetical protein
MNRKERRRWHGPRPIGRLRYVQGTTHPLAAAMCPDCDSDVALIEAAPGRYRIEVRHDDTCPWFSELKRDLSCG